MSNMDTKVLIYTVQAPIPAVITRQTPFTHRFLWRCATEAC